MTSAADRALARAASVGLVVLFALQIHALFSVDFLLTNDGPQHLLTAYVHHFYHSSPLRFDETWFITETLTAHGYREVFDLLIAVVPWRMADRFASSLPVVVGSLGWLAVARAHGGAWQVRGLILLGLSVTWHYWIGLLPFAYATAITPWILVLWLATRLATVVSAVSFAALMVVQSMCHPFPPALVGAAMFLGAVSLRDLPLTVRTTLAGLPALGWVFAIHRATTFSAAASWSDSMGALETYASYLPGPVSAQVVLFGLVLVSVVWSFRSESPVVRRVAVLCGTGILVTILLPRSVGGWDLVGPRTLTFFVPLLFAVGPDAPRPWRASFAAIVWLLAAGYLVRVGVIHRDIVRTWAPTLDVALRTMPKLTGLDWEFQIVDAPLRTAWGIPHYGPSLHLPQVIAIERGGRPIYTQAEDGVLHGILAPPRRIEHLGHIDANTLGRWGRYWGSSDGPERRAIDLAGHFAHMARHDVLFVVGRPEDIQGIERAGYIDVVTLGAIDSGLALFQATPGPGCAATITIDALGADVIEIGVVPRTTPVDAFFVRAGKNMVVAEGLPCGRWWLGTEQAIGTGAAPNMAVDAETHIFLDIKQHIAPALP